MNRSHILALRPLRRTVVTTGLAVAVAVVVAGCGAGDDAAELQTSAQEPAAAEDQQTSGSTPPAEPAVSDGGAADAVQEFYEASKALDQARVVELVCAADRSRFASEQADPSELIATYTIGAATEVRAGFVVVQTTFTTVQEPAPQEVPVPVVREDGAWRVCFAGGAS